MIKKSALVFTLFLMLLASFAAAQNASNIPPSTSSNTDSINKAYQCLDNQIDSKQESSLSLQEAIFGSLALGSDSKLTAVIESKKIGNDHWGESQNQLKDTSQVLLAYDRINRNTASIESWLLSKSVPAAEITWYLQADIPNRAESSCTLSYGSEQRTITINEDMTLSGNPGSCLSIAQSGFWLKVNNNCIDRNFTLSCDQDFITSLLYQRTGSSTIYVSLTTHSASALGQTTESINSKCLSTSSNSCDYEGTLWGALALDYAGKDVSAFLPYLLALSENNLKYFPASFLHEITSGTDQYSQVIQSQQQNKYWQAPNTPYNRYYDSALAMLSLQGTSAQELSNSQDYFLSIQTPEGCWNNNNIRDTGFLLYAGWPRSVPTGTGGNGTGGGTQQLCETAGFSCSSLISCSDIGGSVLNNYTCSAGVCCSESPALQTCTQLEGEICSSGESCSGTSSSSTDGSCCLGSCENLPAANECELAGGSCYTTCNNDETQLSDSCGASSSEVCCKPASTSSASWTLWITILVILIVLVILAIVFRHKLSLWFFKMTKKGPSSTAQRGMPPGRRPPFPPSSDPIPMRPPQRFIGNQQQPLLRKQGVSQTDKDMEETMRKLKDMSK